jgi:hypothetical protein
MPRQFATDNLAVVLVVFDDKDADGIRIALRGSVAVLVKLIAFLTQIAVEHLL